MHFRVYETRSRTICFCLFMDVLVRTLRWIFFFLSIFGIRQWLARAMPQSLVLAVGSGIGLFIAYVIYFISQ